MNSICVFNQMCLSSFTRLVSLICDDNLARLKTWIFFACNVDLSTNLTEKCFVKERKEEPRSPRLEFFPRVAIYIWHSFVVYYTFFIYIFLMNIKFETKYDTYYNKSLEFLHQVLHYKLGKLKFTNFL